MKIIILKLRIVYLTSDGWKDVIEDKDVDNKCSTVFIFTIQKKCKFIYQALSIVYENRKKKITHKTWKQCCEQVKRIEKCEFDYSDIDECDELKIDNETNL